MSVATYFGIQSDSRSNRINIVADAFPISSYVFVGNLKKKKPRRVAEENNVDVFFTIEENKSDFLKMF